jgi:hypothetical protein
MTLGSFLALVEREVASFPTRSGESHQGCD